MSFSSHSVVSLSFVTFGSLVLAVGCGATSEEEGLPPLEGELGVVEEAIAFADGIGPIGGHEVFVYEGCNSSNNCVSSCSGSLLRNDVVLTAAHCVTESSTGTRVRAVSSSGAPTGPWITATAQHAGHCSSHPDMCPPERSSSSVIDTAVLTLATPIAIDGNVSTGFRSLFLGDPQEDEAIRCSGQGRSQCSGGGVGTFRWGNFDVVTITENRTHWQPASNSDAWMLPGDSGAGCWLREQNTQQPQMFTHFTTQDGCYVNNMRGEVLEVFRPWVRSRLAAHASDFWTSFDSTTDHGLLDYVGSVPTDWEVSNGALRYLENTQGDDATMAGPHALVKNQVMANGCIKTKVWSSDDDKAGIIFGYMNEDNYYRFAAWEPDRVRIDKVSQGTRQNLASVAVAVDWSVGVELKACYAKNGRIFGHIDGTQVADATDTEFPDGRVGLYNRNLQNAAYVYLEVKHDDNVYKEQW